MMPVHRTAQGRMIDMQSLAIKNELTPALGNMKVNARGDELGRGGKIVRTKEEIMKAHYRLHNSNVPTDDAVDELSDSTNELEADQDFDPMENQDLNVPPAVASTKTKKGV